MQAVSKFRMETQLKASDRINFLQGKNPLFQYSKPNKTSKQANKQKAPLQRGWGWRNKNYLTHLWQNHIETETRRGLA